MFHLMSLHHGIFTNMIVTALQNAQISDDLKTLQEMIGVMKNVVFRNEGMIWEIVMNRLVALNALNRYKVMELVMKVAIMYNATLIMEIEVTATIQKAMIVMPTN